MSTALPWQRSGRLPLVLQSEAAECGLACLAMVAGYHGLRCDLGGLRRTFGASLRGATLRNLLDAAAALGLSGRGLRVELDELDQLRLPAVLHWDLRHFVVLKRVRGRRVTVVNPALGERTYTRAELSAHLSGVALELTPASTFEPGDVRARMRLTDFWERAPGLGGSMVQVLVLSVVLQALALASPFYMQLVVDEALVKHDGDLVLVLALGFALLTIIRVATTSLRSWVLLYFGQMMAFGMVAHLFRHLLRLPLRWFLHREVGDISSRFGSLAPVQKLFTEGLVATVLDATMALATLVMMLVYAPTLALVVVGAVVAYGAARWAFYPALRMRSHEQIVAGARAESTFIETLRAMPAIRVFSREPEREALWQNRQVEVINSAVRVGRLGIGFGAVNGLLFGLENVLVIWLGAGYVLSGTFTIGMLYAFVAYKGQFAERMAALVDRLVELRMLGLHLERLADIGLEPPELPTRRGVIQRVPEGALALSNASYRYAPDQPWVLTGANLAVPAGALVVICGASGSGKSTLLRLLMALVQPDHGQLQVDGVPAVQFGVADYRAHVAAVMQDDVLLGGSVADNITFGDEQPDLEHMYQCATAAAIDGDVAAMPMGYDSLVGDMGAALSGGQRQRVLLARALYRRPRYLFLDEGTAHLDAANAAVVHAALAAAGMTRVVVTHSPAALPEADAVYQLEAGRLVRLK